jgi:hypothetical protein
MSSIRKPGLALRERHYAKLRKHISDGIDRATTSIEAETDGVSEERVLKPSIAVETRLK